jgi:hypothetical protein
VQLQNASARFAAQGLKLAAISYDSPAILKDFAGRHQIDFPLLSDRDSRIIRSFDVLNEQATGMTKGMAHPGFYFIDPNGVIREKYFEIQYTDRFTPNNVIGKLFPELSEEVPQKIEAPHLQLTAEQSDTMVAPGSRLSLVAQVELPPDVHVYAPGVKGYKPIQLVIDPSPEIEPLLPVYPASRDLYLEAIKENVPVFEGSFRITQDLQVSASREFSKSLGPNGTTLAIKGELHYQACDKTTCFLPTSVPLSWQLKVVPLDRQRSPASIQHK